MTKRLENSNVLTSILNLLKKFLKLTQNSLIISKLCLYVQTFINFREIFLFSISVSVNEENGAVGKGLTLKNAFHEGERKTER